MTKEDIKEIASKYDLHLWGLGKFGLTANEFSSRQLALFNSLEDCSIVCEYLTTRKKIKTIRYSSYDLQRQLLAFCELGNRKEIRREDRGMYYVPLGVMLCAVIFSGFDFRYRDYFFYSNIGKR